MEAGLARRECSASAQRVKDLGAQLAQARSECELYISEIEVRAQPPSTSGVSDARVGWLGLKRADGHAKCEMDR